MKLFYLDRGEAVLFQSLRVTLRPVTGGGYSSHKVKCVPDFRQGH